MEDHAPISDFSRLLSKPKPEAHGLPPCLHCGGQVVRSYGELGCLQCGRAPTTKSRPTTTYLIPNGWKC